MPDQKRALVVDDSKSARLVLRRMLEKHGVTVDTVESATAALDFLNYNRPDVVFMDHMMPGMNGFEAVKAIKANPDTATIPVMMYTSKGGDLYLGQARALGAVGVLPKTVAPAELFTALQRLGLTRERRSKEDKLEENGASERAEDIQQRPATAAPAVEISMPTVPAGYDDEPIDSPLRKLLDEQRVEIRKDMLLSIETVSRQTGTRISRELDEKLAGLQDTGTPPATAGNLPLLILAGLLLLSVTWNLLPRQPVSTPVRVSLPETEAATEQQAEDDSLLSELQSVQAHMEAQRDNTWLLTSWAINQSLDYPYNEIALDGDRIDVIEQLLTRLNASGYTGKVILETHLGEFCLLGDPDQGFRLPAPDASIDQCEFFGNPTQAADTPASQQSLSFANFLSSAPLLQGRPDALEILPGSRDKPLHPYPPKTAPSTAGDWNRVAQQNNRLLIRLPAE